MTEACANCGAALTGAFCGRCGQKRFVETDRRLGHLLRQFVEAATDLDSRFWGSLRALLFRPGRLSRDFIEGRRARWMSPITLFLLVNLVYFLFAQSSDFARPFSWEMPGRITVLASEPGALDAGDVERLRDDPGPPYTELAAALVERRVAKRDAAARAASDGVRGYDFREYRQAYDARVPEVGKATAIVHVPFLAAALLLMFRQSGRYYAEHFVVVLHLLAFVMLLMQILAHGLDFLQWFVPPAEWHNPALNWAVRAVITLYTVIALRCAYRVGWLRAAVSTAGLLLAYVLVNFCLYRPMLFLTVFALT